FPECYNTPTSVERTQKASLPSAMSENALPERDFERLKASLVSLISHELRTPLTYISASLEMLEIAYESPEMQGDVRRFLNIIDQGVKQLNTTIDELLMFSSLEAD